MAPKTREPSSWMKMQIRNAHAGDLDQLSDYIVWGQGHHVAANPDLFAPVDRDAVRSFLLECLDSKASYIRVAERQSTVVGFSFVEIYERRGTLLKLPRRFAYLELIAVDPDHQRSGIGSALLTDAKEIAKSRGIHRIELDVMGFNDGARYFYSGQGFSVLGYRMYIDEPIA
jgi:ribosomal protein S18 acetylase RimI-like enzyme